MNFSTTNINKNTKELSETLNVENEQLNSENAALVESLTSVYYQAYIARNELVKERSRMNVIENELEKAEKEKVRLVSSQRELCQTLKDERAKEKNQETVISMLKTRGKKKIIAIVVLSFLFIGAVFSSVMLVRWGLGSRSLVMNLRETSYEIPGMSEMIPDSIRYSFEEVFHKKW